MIDTMCARATSQAPVPLLLLMASSASSELHVFASPRSVATPAHAVCTAPWRVADTEPRSAVACMKASTLASTLVLESNVAPTWYSGQPSAELVVPVPPPETDAVQAATGTTAARSASGRSKSLLELRMIVFSLARTYAGDVPPRAGTVASAAKRTILAVLRRARRSPARAPLAWRGRGDLALQR